ncbi:MAG TPA: ABC transporter ATP-binding protein [Polyangiales bacterium]|nr:ABC transporter ATP-binding protein [Polyangiales bacterium]
MSTDAIRLEGLRRRYGRVHALDGLNVSARPSEVYGFLGRNGAGKTTTLRILMGIVPADSGQIHLFGERIERVSVAVKRGIGYVSQEQNFYPWMTARQLGDFVAAFYPSWDAHEYERMLGVLDVAPNQRSVELSGGTRTKLALALALAPRPPLLLLDEPTAGLDPVARREFHDLVSEVVRERGVTVFLSSHLVDEVEDIATRVGIIQAGRMRVEGDVPRLRETVRRVRTSEPYVPPAGFTQVRNDIWEADPERWSAAEWPEGVTIEALSLEDIFLAFARTPGRAAAAR